MKESNFDALIERIARKKATSNIRKSHTKPVSRFAKSTSATSGTGGFPEIHKGSAPDVVLDVHICFAALSNAGESFEAEQKQQAKAAKQSVPPQVHKLLPMFTEAELAEVYGTQAAILSWIGDSDAKARLFFNDPLQALKDAGITLHPLLLKKIEQQRSRAVADSSKKPLSMPSARIRSIKVHACPNGGESQRRAPDVNQRHSRLQPGPGGHRSGR